MDSKYSSVAIKICLLLFVMITSEHAVNNKKYIKQKLAVEANGMERSIEIRIYEWSRSKSINYSMMQ